MDLLCKRACSCVLLLFALTIILTGCVTYVPNSADAKAKLEDKGYVVSLHPVNTEPLEAYGDDQLILLNAEKDGVVVLQSYFFRNKEDTDRYFKERGTMLRSDVEAFHKFGYVICRGTAEAMEAFLA